MTKLCFLCKESQTLTTEHIIPQAIGGKVKAKLYCKRCNENCGNLLDNEIVKQFGWIGTLLNIKRERGETQPYEVKDLSSGAIRIFDGKRLATKNPIVKKESKDNKKLDFADVTARSMEELNKIFDSIKKRYEVIGAIRKFENVNPGPTDAENEMIIDNALLRRAVSKIAYGFLCIKLPKESILSLPFDKIREYIITGSRPDLACANYIYTLYMTDYIRPLHKIHISLNRSEKLVVGYLSLFGIFRLTILLAENYYSKFEWPGLDYTFDPVRLEQVFGNENFRAPKLSKENILHPKQPKKFIENELSKGMSLIKNYDTEYEFLKGEL